MAVCLESTLCDKRRESWVAIFFGLSYSGVVNGSNLWKGSRRRKGVLVTKIAVLNR